MVSHFPPKGFKSGRRRIGSEWTLGGRLLGDLGVPSPRTWDGEGWARSFLGVGFKSGRRRVGLEGTLGAGCSVISGLPSPRTWDGEGWTPSFLGVGSQWATACRRGGGSEPLRSGLGCSAKKPSDFWTRSGEAGFGVQSRTAGADWGFAQGVHTGRRRPAVVVARECFGAYGEGFLFTVKGNPFPRGSWAGEGTRSAWGWRGRVAQPPNAFLIGLSASDKRPRFF